jgi:hypothetical protein
MAYEFNPFTGTFDNTGSTLAPASSLLGIDRIANRYYFGWGVAPGTAGTRVATASRVYYVLFINPKTTTWTRIGTRVSTGIVSSFTRLGLYEVGSTGLPTTRLQDFGTVGTATSGDKEITISYEMPPGNYYLALVCDAGVTFAGHLTESAMAAYTFGASLTTSGASTALWYEASTGNDLPSTANTTLSNEDTSLRRPMIYLRSV